MVSGEASQRAPRSWSDGGVMLELVDAGLGGGRRPVIISCSRGSAAARSVVADGVSSPFGSDFGGRISVGSPARIFAVGSGSARSVARACLDLQIW